MGETNDSALLASARRSISEIRLALRHLSDTVDRLEVQLRERATRLDPDEATETILQLREALLPPAGTYFEGLHLTRSEQALLHALLSHRVPVSIGRLRSSMDAALGKWGPEGGALRSVDVVVCRLRKRLAALEPAIRITTDYGHGYFLDPESRRRLEARRLNVHVAAAEPVH